MSMLVVGTVAFDSIETPHGSAEMILGGSGTYASYAASFFTQPRLVGVVGEDFPSEHLELLQGRGIDTAGVHTEPGGKTFYWKGRYHQNMNDRDTVEVHLNVIENFDPKVPQEFRDSKYVFLGNFDPVAQARVLDQIDKPEMVLADTMDLWIQTKHDELMQLMPRLDGILINDSEAKLLTGVDNLVEAGAKVREMGPRFVVIKKGEHGAMLCTPDGIFVIPAFPTQSVTDPTGAGDVFAGGVAGYLTREPGDAKGRLRRGMAYGSVLASLNVEGFGLDRLKQVSMEEVDGRLGQYREMLAF